MKKLIYLFLLGTFLVPIDTLAQDYWNTYRKADGLVDSIVVDITFGTNRIYLATPRGLSVFENENFTNYDTSNSNLASQNIRIIRAFGDTLYMVTDSGLTEFSNGVFKNYNITNGLITNAIEDIELTSTGELFIATQKGLTRKVGNQFIDDSSKVIYDLGVNSGDTVYANVNNRAIANIPTVTAEVFTNGVWSPTRDTSSAVGLQNARFVNLQNGRIGISTTNEGGFLVSDLFKLDQILIPSTRSAARALLKSMDIDSESNVWFGLGGNTLLGSEIGTLYEYVNGDFKTHQIGLPNKSVNVVKCRNGKVYIGTNNGFAVASDSINEFPEVLSIETNSLKASFSAVGPMFSKNPNSMGGTTGSELAGLEYPKDLGTYVIYSSSYWMSSHSQNQDLYLSFQTYTNGNFNSGTINDNKTAVRPNMIAISKLDITNHLKNYNTTGYQVPEVIKSWPANGRVELGESIDQAPFVDANANGCYDPENGDYPAIMGDRALYIIINDDTREAVGAFDKRFNAEIHTMVYVFDAPTVDYIDQSIFVRSTFINRSNRTYTNVNVGNYMDFDVGTPINDASGCDLSSNSFFGYTADTIDDNSFTGIKGYGRYSPFVGVKYMNRKLEGHVFPGVGTTVGAVRNGLDNLWFDSLQVSVGGDGRNRPVTTPTDYLYFGRLDRPTEWSFIHPGANYPPNSLGDTRSLGKVVFPEWKPGEREVVDYVVSVAQDSSKAANYGNYKVLMEYFDKASRFQQGIDSITPDGVFSNCVTGIAENKEVKESAKNLLIYPNPTQGELMMVGNELIEQITVFDSQGKQLFTKNVENDLMIQSITLPGGWSNGLYFVQVQMSGGQLASKQFVLQR